MSKSAVLSLSLTFTPPGGGSEVVSVSNSAPYNAMEAGTQDIPATTATAVEFVLSLGSVAKPTCVLIKNTNNQEMVVRQQITGATADYSLPIGGVHLVHMPAAPVATPYARLSVLTSTTQVGTGTVDYYVFGD